MSDNQIEKMNDPWEVLDISRDAGEEEIREAYLKRIKAYPPDRYPDAFERTKEAYDTLKDPLRRAERALLFADPEAPLKSLLKAQKGQRSFVGPKPWLDALKNG